MSRDSRRKWTAQYEFYAHRRRALDAGLNPIGAGLTARLLAHQDGQAPLLGAVGAGARRAP